ncbi:uncharacterized protein V1518DRAFT_427882 [Limtongia smithiae]|uniref:uncharacterized protein n=1 Tax=Limtongia smithiae TaxID=1125753 RepID=UPI0034CE44E6
MNYLIRLLFVVSVIFASFGRAQKIVTVSSTSTSSTEAASSTSSATTSTTTAETLIWVTVTGTDSNGLLYTSTVETPFTQTFYSMYTSISSPKSGSIGLGTISGSVGAVKAASSAVTNGGAAGMVGGGRGESNHVGLFAGLVATFMGIIMGSGSLFFM